MKSSLSAKQKNNPSLGRTLLRLGTGLSAFGLLIAMLLRGKNIAILDAKGTIASQQRGLIFYVLTVILAIAVPTVILLYFTAWRYRESHSTATYHPEAKTGKAFIVAIWALPTFVMLLLAIALVPATHKLQPNKALASSTPPITIQVMAMRWKWLFIYPDQQIATVNYVQIPKDVPIVFDLTADEAPMSSFWIPNLSGQLYAMTGHINRLNLMASENGDYRGRSAEINGAGFAGMQFTARVSSKQDFESWVDMTKQSASTLDKATYQTLVKPSENNAVTAFYPVDDSLYADTVMKYMGSHDHQMTAQTQHEGMY
ncbi:MAG: COX aromatic rich motif-containing protein [Patescibacteria group bacterium]|nr:COX aromatic rich motif-containing protein [Patescibacteria group bacterium]